MAALTNLTHVCLLAIMNSWSWFILVILFIALQTFGKSLALGNTVFNSLWWVSSEKLFIVILIFFSLHSIYPSFCFLENTIVLQTPKDIAEKHLNMCWWLFLVQCQQPNVCVSYGTRPAVVLHMNCQVFALSFGSKSVCFTSNVDMTILVKMTVYCF